MADTQGVWEQQRAGARAYRFYTLDVFCDRPFGGNPLAVVPQAAGLSTAEMQRITREFNLSETVFVLPPETPTGTCRVRIFTPAQEIPFAGHPTVGTAFLLAALGQVPLASDAKTGDDITIVLEEGIGPVPVGVKIEGDRPVSSQLIVTQAPQRWDVALTPEDLAGMLGLEPGEIGWGAGVPAVSVDAAVSVDTGLSPGAGQQSRAVGTAQTVPPWQPEAFSCGLPYCFVPVATRSALGRIQLQIDRWHALLATTPYPNLYCFCPDPEHPAAHFRARMFAPALGITEDAATGSAVTALAGYLSARSPVAPDLGEVETLGWGIEQGVEMGRPSFLSLEIDRRGGTLQTIRVGGRSVPISEGTLYL